MTVDGFHAKALLAVMHASQTLPMIGNLIIPSSEKLPFVFLHRILLSGLMGRRTLAFGSIRPPVGGFWISGGITTLSYRHSDTGR